MPEIFLFRHGKTIANEKKTFCGVSETELIDCDEKNDFLFPSVDVLFSSPLYRCVFYKNFVRFSEVKISENLMESNFGVWENKTFDEIQKHFPKQAEKYLKHPLSFKFPEGESLKDIKKRVKHFIEKELKKKLMENKNILIISHEGIIKLIIMLLLNLNDDFFLKCRIENRKFSIVEYFYENNKIDYILEKINVDYQEGENYGR
jgi:alpha-ribazole phosphatase